MQNTADLLSQIEAKIKSGELYMGNFMPYDQYQTLDFDPQLFRRLLFCVVHGFDSYTLGLIKERLAEVAPDSLHYQIAVAQHKILEQSHQQITLFDSDGWPLLIENVKHFMAEPMTYEHLFLAFKNAGIQARAYTALRSLVALEPNDWLWHYSLMTQMPFDGSEQQRNAYLDRAYELSNDAVMVLLNKGRRMFFNESKRKEGQDFLEKAFSLNPEHSEVFFALIDAYNFSDQFDLEVKAYEKRFELVPRTKQSLFDIKFYAQALIKNDQSQKAIEVSTQTLNTYDFFDEVSKIDLYQVRIEAHLALDHFESALKDVQIVLATMPEDYFSREKVYLLAARVYKEIGRYQEAIALIAPICEDPNAFSKGELYLLLGKIHHKNNDLEAAGDAWKKAARIYYNAEADTLLKTHYNPTVHANDFSEFVGENSENELLKPLFGTSWIVDFEQTKQVAAMLADPNNPLVEMIKPILASMKFTFSPKAIMINVMEQTKELHYKIDRQEEQKLVIRTIDSTNGEERTVILNPLNDNSLEVKNEVSTGDPNQDMHLVLVKAADTHTQEAANPALNMENLMATMLSAMASALEQGLKEAFSNGLSEQNPLDQNTLKENIEKAFVKEKSPTEKAAPINLQTEPIGIDELLGHWQGDATLTIALNPSMQEIPVEFLPMVKQSIEGVTLYADHVHFYLKNPVDDHLSFRLDFISIEPQETVMHYKGHDQEEHKHATEMFLGRFIDHQGKIYVRFPESNQDILLALKRP